MTTAHRSTAASAVPGRRTLPASVDVLIVGAGPTGLTAAVSLAQAGVDVVVLERDAGPITASRALLVQPRVLELWRQLGIADEAVSRGRLVTRIDVHVGSRTGGSLRYDGTGRTPYPHGLVLEQSATQRLLLDRLLELGHAPRWGDVVDGVSQDEEGVLVEVTQADGTVSAVRARYVIGADGASSTVRRHIGQTLEGDTYGASFFLADTVLTTPLDPSRLHLSVTRTHVHVLFPMPGRGRWRAVGSLTPQESSHYVGSGAERATTDMGLDDVRELVASSGLDVRVDDVHWATAYLIHRRIVDSFSVGRIFLAGDSAHLHSPAGGQGMNTGIGDAINIAWKLAAVVHGHAPETLLDTYAAERRPVAEDVLAKSDRLFELEASQTAIAGVARVVAFPLLARLLSRTGVGRRVFFDRLSQVGVSYAREAVPSGRRSGSRLGPGDRLPFLPVSGSETTHDLLEPRHVLLVAPGTDDAEELGAAERLWRAELDRSALPVGLHVLPGSQKRLLRTLGHPHGVAVLVRPDGHMERVAPSGQPAVLAAHLRRHYAVRVPGPARIGAGTSTRG